MVEPAGDWFHAQTVTDDLRDQTPAGVEVDRLLLAAKLSVPQPRQGSVSRAGLIEAAKASGCRVVGITAPAGYGKSTLLSQWALAEDRRVAWVSLNGFDDDPAGLLTLLASAYARVSPGNDDLVADMGGLGVSALGRSAPLLAAVLSTSQAPFVLMLDDLHELRSPACHDVLGVVISGIPRGSQLAAASRSEQPHVPRLRAAGDAWELGASDLALDVDAAEQIFAQAHVSISREEAAAVTERTEGWPAGLYLAAMIARASPGQGLTVSGDDRFVADYLYRESLSQLPESTQRFLRRTAVLDQLCAPLCDALLEDASSQDRLRELESLELVPDPAGSSARVVPLPRTVPRVPARRASSRRARRHHDAASAGRRLVRGKRISRACPRAPAEHHHPARPMRPTGDAARNTDLQGWPHVNRATVAVGARRPSDRGLPPTGRACRLVRGADRADRRSAAVGRAPRRRFV